MFSSRSLIFSLPRINLLNLLNLLLLNLFNLKIMDLLIFCPYVSIMLMELFCLISHLLGDTSELLLILNFPIPCIILTLIEFTVQLFQLFVFFLFLRIKIFLLLCNLSCFLIVFFFVFFRLFFKCLIIFLFGLFEVFFIFLFNFFDLLQKFVFIFQNFSDVFAKEWGIALSECLYFRH